MKKVIKKSIIKNPLAEAMLEYMDDFNLKFLDSKETLKGAKLSTSNRKEKYVADFFLSILPNKYSIKRGEICLY